MPAKRKHKCYNGRYFEWKLYQRDSVWWADGRSNQIDHGRRSLGTRLFEEAKEVLEKLDLKMAVEHGLAKPEEVPRQNAEQISIENGIDLYREYLGRSRLVKGVRESSAVRYRTVFKKFSEFAKKNGVHYWHQVSTQIVEAYLGCLEKRGLAPNTLILEITTIKQVNKFLIDKKKLPSIAKIQLPLVKPEGSDRYCYRVAEVEAIMAQCAKDPLTRWLCDVVISLAYTGLRISELADLRWNAIDLETGMITLRDETTMARRKGRAIVTTKGRRNRSLPIHDELRTVLESIERKSDQFVFHGPHGGRVQPSTARKALIRVALKPLASTFPTPPDEVGFADARLHSFRHFFCSFCANRGVPQNVVMKWLGHRDSKMVERYYHLHDQEAQLQMQKLKLKGSTIGA